MKLSLGFLFTLNLGPAAFGRLCVETLKSLLIRCWYGEPAAFGRLCVETTAKESQTHRSSENPAAFGRLCVETTERTDRLSISPPAAFGRLCVETRLLLPAVLQPRIQPPSGGCVLKLACGERSSRNGLPAAFGRLCVETNKFKPVTTQAQTSRLRAAVC